MLNHGLILGTSDQCSTADQSPHSGQGGWIDTWGGAPTVSRDLHPGLILRRQSAMPLPNRLIRKNPEPRTQNVTRLRLRPTSTHDQRKINICAGVRRSVLGLHPRP